jgi:hypothetical protein
MQSHHHWGHQSHVLFLQLGAGVPNELTAPRDSKYLKHIVPLGETTQNFPNLTTCYRGVQNNYAQSAVEDSAINVQS